MRIRSWALAAAAIVLVGGWLVLRMQHAAVPPAVVSAHNAELLRDAESPVEGNPDGDVTLVEFFDYNCPYCRQMLPTIAQAEAADPLLRVVYKVWPILGTSSIAPAKAALAAGRQGQFIALHRALYQIRGEVDESKALAAAQSIGLDMERLKSDMRSPATEAAVKRNLALASALGIDGTPGFVIGTRVFAGPTDLTALQVAVGEARSATSSVN
jgi:protein-disulfide isomerase